jgi:hypothetical protein
MTDSNQTYLTLAKYLSNTRKTLYEVCKEHDINIYAIDLYKLQEYIDQCSHCNIWSTRLIPDLDDNPICPVCVKIAGM